VGYIPFEPEAANLFFQLVSARYERASLIVTSNKPFGRWGEVFGDEVVAAAMVDRLSTTPKSSPSKATATGSKTATSAASHRQPKLTTDHRRGVHFQTTAGGPFSADVDILHFRGGIAAGVAAAVVSADVTSVRAGPGRGPARRSPRVGVFRAWRRDCACVT
jgi:hypothetical protein